MPRPAALSSLSLLACSLLLTFTLASPAVAAGEAPLPGPTPLDSVEQIAMPPVDHAALLAEDAAAAGPGVPVRFALPLEGRWSPDLHGTWEQAEGDLLVWRLRVSSPGALSINLGFKRFVMPRGGRLFVFSPDRKAVLGPYTAADNESHGELWTPLLPGDEAVIQVEMPAASWRRLELELTSVNHGYRRFGSRPEKSGACNVDVICPEGDGWRDEIRSVAGISTGGSVFCTGFLVNNTAEDLTPYFMTANHCGINSGNAASLVVYWNFENTTCRPPGSPASGGPGDGSLAQNQTGSFFRSSYAPSDFTLVELDDDPDPAFNVHWAGWDATASDFAGAIAIHHPSGDEKRISFENDPTTTTSYLGSSVPGDGSHVRVEDWDVGTTEPGSSGSPLYNPAHQVIGQLHGGFAACGNDDADWYGRVSVSWTGGGSAASRLSDWLDPGSTGALTLDGRDAIEEIDVQPSQQAICTGDDAVYTVGVEEFNGMEMVTLSVSGEPAGATTGFSVNPVAPPAMSTLTVGNTGGVSAGSYTLTVTGMSMSATHMLDAGLDVYDGLPAAPAPTAPANGAINQAVRPTFSWAAAAGAASYSIEIATDAGFGTVVDSATGLTETSYTASVDLASDSEHFWRVTADNGCGTGPDSATFSFTTMPLPGDCSAGSFAQLLMDDDLEGGAAGWTSGGSGDTWTLSSARTHSGTNAYHAEDVTSVSDQLLTAPSVSVPAGAAPVSLLFWNYQSIEDRAGGCFDGAVVEVSTDGGSNWTRLGGGDLLTDPYDGPIDGGFSNPLAGEDAWCGDPQDWLRSVVDLSAYAGQTVTLRFRLATDSSVGREGWYIDDVAVQACLAGEPIFSDGFESGDTTAWDTTVP